MNTNDKQRLSLIFKFIETFQNQIRLFDFDVNCNQNEQICGVIRLNENSNLEEMEQFLIENKHSVPIIFILKILIIIL